eukprot:gene3335-6599_t
MAKKGGLFGTNNDNEQDVYDFALDDGIMNSNKGKYSFGPESDDEMSYMGTKKASSSSKADMQKVSSSNVKPNANITTGSSTESAMEKAKNMLNKYSTKNTGATAGGPPRSTMQKNVAKDFDEDDISLGSSMEEDSTLDLEDSDGPRTKPKPLPKKAAPEPVKTSIKSQNNSNTISDMSKPMGIQQSNTATAKSANSFTSTSTAKSLGGITSQKSGYFSTVNDISISMDGIEETLNESESVAVDRYAGDGEEPSTFDISVNLSKDDFGTYEHQLDKDNNNNINNKMNMNKGQAQSNYHIITSKDVVTTNKTNSNSSYNSNSNVLKSNKSVVESKGQELSVDIVHDEMDESTTNNNNKNNNHNSDISNTKTKVQKASDGNANGNAKTLIEQLRSRYGGDSEQTEVESVVRSDDKIAAVIEEEGEGDGVARAVTFEREKPVIRTFADFVSEPRLSLEKPPVTVTVVTAANDSSKTKPTATTVTATTSSTPANMFKSQE